MRRPGRGVGRPTRGRGCGISRAASGWRCVRGVVESWKSSWRLEVNMRPGVHLIKRRVRAEITVRDYAKNDAQNV